MINIKNGTRNLSFWAQLLTNSKKNVWIEITLIESLKSLQWVYQKKPKKTKKALAKLNNYRVRHGTKPFSFFTSFNGNQLFAKIGHSPLPQNGWLSEKHALHEGKSGVKLTLDRISSCMIYSLGPVKTISLGALLSYTKSPVIFHFFLSVHISSPPFTKLNRGSFFFFIFPVLVFIWYMHAGQ